VPLPRKLTPDKVAYARGIMRRRQKLLDELQELPSEARLATELGLSRCSLRRLKDGTIYRDVQ
jgi:AraC-like DNA-binding protein